MIGTGGLKTKTLNNEKVICVRNNLKLNGKKLEFSNV